MILEGAIYPVVYSETSLDITTATISDSTDGKQKRLSFSKWPANYFTGPEQLKAAIQESCSSEQTRNILWEHEPNLKTWDTSSVWSKIIWIESNSEESIRRSFFQVARELKIVSLDDDEQDPQLSSKVYRHLDKKCPAYVDAVLFIFRCSNQPKIGSQVCQQLIRCTPPSDLKNKNFPSVLITSESAKPLTRFMDLPKIELDQFIFEFNQIRYPGQYDDDDPEVYFLISVAILFRTYAYIYDANVTSNTIKTKTLQAELSVLPTPIPTEKCPPKSFKTVLLKALHEFCEERLRRSGRLVQASLTKVTMKRGADDAFNSPDNRTNNVPTVQTSPVVHQSSELLDIHNFFVSRRRADAIWDKTLILSTQTAYKLAREYVENFGDFYDAVVQINCFNVGQMKESFVRLASHLGLTTDDGRSYSVFSPNVAISLYEYFAKNLHGNVLFVFWCPTGSRADKEMSFIADYLPMRFLSNNQCPFTLIANFHSISFGIMKQPSSFSRNFASDLSMKTNRERVGNAVRTQLNAFPLAKALFVVGLQEASEEDLYTILKTELCNVDLKFEERAADYDPEDAVVALMGTQVDLREAVVWTRLMNQTAWSSIGRRALSFLWNVARLQESPANNSPVSLAPEDVYAVELQLSLLGSEFKEEVERTLSILRKNSLLRYFDSDDGKCTVMMHTVVRDLVRFAPCSSSKSEENTTLLLLARAGRVSLNLHQMSSLLRQMDLLAADTFAQLHEVTVDCSSGDPNLQRNLSEFRKDAKEKLQWLSSYGGQYSKVVMNVKTRSLKWESRTEVIGIKAEGDVLAGRNVSVSVASSGNELTPTATKESTEKVGSSQLTFPASDFSTIVWPTAVRASKGDASRTFGGLDRPVGPTDGKKHKMKEDVDPAIGSRDMTTTSVGKENKRRRELLASSSPSDSSSATHRQKKKMKAMASEAGSEFSLVLGYRSDPTQPISLTEFLKIYDCLQAGAILYGLSGFDAKWHKGRVILFGPEPPRSDIKQRVRQFVQDSFLTWDPQRHFSLYQCWDIADAPQCLKRYIYNVCFPYFAGFTFPEYSSVMAGLNPGLEGDWTVNPGSLPEVITGEHGKRMWSLDVIVSALDANYIDSRDGLLKGPGLGLGHQFTRVGVVELGDGAEEETSTG